MAAIAKMSLTGKYGEVVQVHPLQHTPQIVVKVILKPHTEGKLLELRLYYAFVNYGMFKDNIVELFEDIAEHVDQCLGVDGFAPPKIKREEWFEIGFTQALVDKYHWPCEPKVIQ